MHQFPKIQRPVFSSNTDLLDCHCHLGDQVQFSDSDSWYQQDNPIQAQLLQCYQKSPITQMAK